MSLSAGCRRVELADGGVAFPALVLYPAAAPEWSVTLGPYPLDAALDAPVAAGRWPLVLVSHGMGGSHLLYRGLMAHLARHGFVTVAPEHPFDNRNDRSRSGTAAILADRPRQLRAAANWAFAEFGASVVPDALAVVGHSMGGYSGLALSGGEPVAFARETPDGVEAPVEVVHDPRVRALVLLAPATPWFRDPATLRGVRVPILMVTGEQDQETTSWHASNVLAGVPEPGIVEHVVVPNAGHFAFLTPFPASMTSPAFPPSQDPPGFDRAAFHLDLNARVLAFLSRTLP